MAFYCNGKNGVCDSYPICQKTCECFDGSGGKHINTNADRIRAMSDEELAKFIANPCECSVNPTEDGYRECGNELCKKHLLEWLKQPADQPKG